MKNWAMEINFTPGFSSISALYQSVVTRMRIQAKSKFSRAALKPAILTTKSITLSELTNIKHPF